MRQLWYANAIRTRSSSQIFDLSKNRTKTGCNAGSLMGSLYVLRSSTVLPSRFLAFSLSLFSLPRGTDILYSHFFSLFQPVLKLCTVLLSHFLSLFLTFSLSLRSTDILYSHFFSCFLTFHDHTSTARYSRVPRGTHAGGTRARHARGTRARHFVDSRAVLARVMRGTRLERLY